MGFPRKAIFDEPYALHVSAGCNWAARARASQELGANLLGSFHEDRHWVPFLGNWVGSSIHLKLFGTRVFSHKGSAIAQGAIAEQIC